MLTKCNEIDIVSYLSSIGLEPSKICGNDHWYLSPFRNERTPSFKVNSRINKWYDFGEGKGGGVSKLIDLLNASNNYKPGIVADLKTFSTSPSLLQNPSPAIQVLSVSAITSKALVNYYSSRGILPAIANAWLKEIRYQTGAKMYHALGFLNDAGGFELRSQYFKGSVSPKAVTTALYQQENLAVFEGFFDFLSFLSATSIPPTKSSDYLILNSTAFFVRYLPMMQAYPQVQLFLDNDVTGSRCTALALDQWPQQFNDGRSLFTGFKDCNEWLQASLKIQPPDRSP